MTKAAKSTECTLKGISIVTNNRWLDRLPSTVLARVIPMRRDGKSWREIRDAANERWEAAGFPAMPSRMESRVQSGLNVPCIPTATLKKWYVRHSGVAAIKRREQRKNSHSRHPRIGEKRKHRKPLRIDSLTADVKETIVAARCAGMTWAKTAEVASAKAGVRLSHSSVQRWHDLRIEQPLKDAGDVAPLLREIIALLKSRLPAVNA
ncbi:MAG TPA: hypothetical protein VHA06_01215 [Candidatus Angelobacter sp.]|jgi:hypothetical protein|nr:hypothetical protein [Candidatus Angelobacter sp.]